MHARRRSHASICSLWRTKRDLCIHALGENLRKVEKKKTRKCRSSVLPRATSKIKRGLKRGLDVRQQRERESVRNPQYMKHKINTVLQIL